MSPLAMEQPFNPFRQGTIEEQITSQVHKTAPTPGEAEDLFAVWTENSPYVSNLILTKKAASKSSVLVAWGSHHLPAEQSLPGGPGHGAGRPGPSGGSEARSAAWLRAQCPQSGAATPHHSPAPSHGGERTGAIDPASPRVFVPAPGDWALLSSLKTPSYFTLQIHSLNALPAPGLCPASTRLWRGTCSRKLPLIVSRDAVLPDQGNSTVSERPFLFLFLLLQPLPPSPWVRRRLLRLPLCYAALSLQETQILLIGGSQWLSLLRSCLP